MQEIELTKQEKELIEYMKTASDFIEDKHLKNMVAVKIMSRATAALLAHRELEKELISGGESPPFGE